MTHFFQPSQYLSVTTLSSCITMTLSLTMASLRPGTRFAIEGFIAGLFSTIFVAAYPILLSHTYTSFFAHVAASSSGSSDGKDVNRTSWKLLHYTNIISIMLVFPWLILSGELRDISRNCYFLDVAFFWLMMLGAGAAAFGTFVAGFLLTRATTPLTVIVSTYPRSALQSVLIVGLKLPTWSWVGVAMCWGSSVWYAVGRRRECVARAAFGWEDNDVRIGRGSRRLND